MTNLEYLAWFLEETYGAICFHNDELDGYRVYSDGDERAIETLGIFFSNEADLSIPEIRERLEKKAGKDFYKRYQAAKEHSSMFLHGYVALKAYWCNGKPLWIRSCERLLYRWGEIDTVMEYFMGVDIELVLFKPMNPSALSMPTNNGFCVPYGHSVKEELEKFLMAQGKPLVSEENGFYVRPPRRRLAWEEIKAKYQRIYGDEVEVCYLPKMRFQNEGEYFEEKIYPLFREDREHERLRVKIYNRQVDVGLREVTEEAKELRDRFHAEQVKYPGINRHMKYYGWQLPYLIQPTEMEEDQHYFDLWEDGEPELEELR